MPKGKADLRDILKLAVKKEASDIHLKSGISPVFRIHREIFTENSFAPLTSDQIREFLNQITIEEQRRLFAQNWELDFAYSLDGIGRFRVNAYFQMGTVALAFRHISPRIPGFKQLGLPDICRKLSLLEAGLIILTGPTGCGKSTTLAAMINYMNQNIRRSIITIEDPIEYLYEDKKCIISQREVGVDTDSFASALKHVLRQDPDVILIGEMRDLETMAVALTAAETGHLILTTLHTPSTYGAIDRLIDSFPSHQHRQIRIQLASVLQAVLYQVLVPRIDEEGVVPAVEVLVASPAIKNLIRENRTYEIPSYLHSGKELGMQTLDQSLIDLFQSGKISSREALAHLRGYNNIEASAILT